MGTGRPHRTGRGLTACRLAQPFLYFLSFPCFSLVYSTCPPTQSDHSLSLTAPPFLVFTFKMNHTAHSQPENAHSAIRAREDRPWGWGFLSARHGAVTSPWARRAQCSSAGHEVHLTFPLLPSAFKGLAKGRVPPGEEVWEKGMRAPCWPLCPCHALLVPQTAFMLPVPGEFSLSQLQDLPHGFGTFVGM